MWSLTGILLPDESEWLAIVPRKKANTFHMLTYTHKWWEYRDTVVKDAWILSPSICNDSSQNAMWSPWGGLSSTIYSLERICHMYSMSACIHAHSQATQLSQAAKGGSQRSLKKLCRQACSISALVKVLKLQVEWAWGQWTKKTYSSSAEKLTVFP